MLWKVWSDRASCKAQVSSDRQPWVVSETFLLFRLTSVHSDFWFGEQPWYFSYFFLLQLPL